MFLSQPTFSNILTGEDHNVFKCLVSLDVKDYKAVILHPNPYFEDTKLVKAFSFYDNGSTKIIGTILKWKDGMDETSCLHKNKFYSLHFTKPASIL